MDLIPSDKVALLWTKLTRLAISEFPQSVLFLGPNVPHTLALTQQLIKRLLCSEEDKPCGDCRSCNFLRQNKHPDVLFITQEKPTSAIKIDQIRSLQSNIYQTPLCATHRVIIIHPANELNRAASNALLKILEEPPKHAIFILLAEHLNTLPATIMSRCQRYHVPESKITSDANTPGYLSLGMHYPEDSPRGILFQQQQEIIDKLCDLSDRKISVCQLASTWGNHAIHDWLWFFQLFTASVLLHQLLPEEPVFFDVRVQHLAQAYSPVHFFKQLDIIQELTKKINLDIPLNLTLALEILLMGYTK
jgi:DNA polymerase III subunit delta'